MDAKKIHDLDQETGPLNEFAVKPAAYYRSLKAEGFTNMDALLIVISYQTEIIRNALGRNDNGR